MKNAFYFIFKALFVLKIFKFLSCHFGHILQKKRLEQKNRVNFKQVVKTSCRKVQINDPEIYSISFFLEKGLGLVSRPHFVRDILRKNFLMLYSINLPNFIVSLLVLLQVLDNMYIAIACFRGCDVINVEIHLIFLINLVFF